jgi:hypothetical protein
MTLVALFLPFWIFACLAPLYAFIFAPYELLILGVCIDAQFADTARGVGYAYTGFIALITLAVMAARPLLRFYA